MDGLSAAASVIAVIQLTKAVGGSLRDLYRDIRDARTEIKQIYDSIISLEMIVKPLDDLIKSRNIEMMNAELLEHPQGPLKQAQLLLQSIKDKLAVQTLNSRFEKTTLSVRQSTKRSLKWPFQKQEVLAIVARLESQKSSLMMDTTINTLAIQFDHSDILRDIRKEIAAAQSDRHHQLVVEWLSKSVPDPSVEHNNALNKHEDTTGSWLIEGDELKEWIETPNSSLWIYGSAGAGKSVLCSTVIAHTQEKCKNEVNATVVYWYFTFRDASTQTVDQCLRSLVANLCSKRRDIPEAIQHAYEQPNNGQLTPDTKTLMTMLSAAIGGFEHVYVLLDALDECPKYDQEREGERDKLLQQIHEIFSWKKGCMHFLATSRKERDIEESFSEIPEHDNFKAISVQGNHLEMDIRKYIRSRLSSNHIKKWKKKLKEEVELKLSSQADGMFRLVALQLDVLLKLPSPNSIRKALDTLPKTLDTFYDKILMDIPEENQQRAVIALQWIAFSARPLTVAELVEAIIIEPRQEPAFNPEERFMDQNDIFDILPAGLVRRVMRYPQEFGRSRGVDPRYFVEFAHFSVLEYLVSARMSPTLGSIYHIDEIEAHTMMAESCLSYLLYIGVNESWIADTFWSRAKFEEIYSTGFEHGQDTNSENKNDELHEINEDQEQGEDNRSEENDEDKDIHYRLYAVEVSYRLQELHPTSVQRLCKQLQDRYVFSLYANGAWSNHISMLTFAGAKCLDRLALDFLDIHGKSWAIWCGTKAWDFWFASSAPPAPRVLRYLASCVNGSSVEIIHPLTWVSWLGHSSLLKLLLNESPPELVDLVLRPGANVDTIASQHYGVNENPLIAACSRASMKIATLLLEAGADINVTVPSYLGGTPLIAASTSGNLDLVTLLLHAGADVNVDVPHTRWHTALIAASANSHLEIVRILLQAGADISAVTQGYRFHTTLSAASHFGQLTALLAACEYGQLDVVKLLLEHGADVNIPSHNDNRVRTPLKMAIESGEMDIIRLLLAYGAYIGSEQEPESPYDLALKRRGKRTTLGYYPEQLPQPELDFYRNLICLYDMHLGKHQQAAISHRHPFELVNPFRGTDSSESLSE